MHATIMVGQFLARPSHNKQEQDLNLSQLNSDERACYERIAKDLLRFCQERVVDLPPINSPDARRRTYVITFRKSESWREIESKFNTLGTKVFNSTAKNWIKTWQTRINNLRMQQNKIQDCIGALQGCKRELNNCELFPHETEIIKKRMELITLEIEEARKVINTVLLTGANEIKDNLKVKELTDNLECKRLLDFLHKHWPQLIVFYSWSEVPMDEAKLSVRVCPSNRVNTSDNESKEKIGKKSKGRKEEIDKAEDEYEQYLIDISVKAILLVEEKETEERPVEYNGTSPVTIIRPTGIGLKQKCFANASPNARKRSSSIKLTDEMIFDYHFNDEKKKEENKTASITSLAERIECITDLAFKKVNQVLSRSDGSLLTEEAIEALIKEDKNENDQTPQTSWNRLLFNFNIDYSLLKPFFGLGSTK